MALRESWFLPDKRLRQVSKPVAKIDAADQEACRGHVRDDVEAPGGIGLAAIQIGEPVRVVTMDLAKDEDIESSRKCSSIRADLDLGGEEHPRGGHSSSIPEYYEEVDRPAEVKVTTIPASGQAARERGRRPSCHLHPARDRPSQRRAVHRPHLEAESATASSRSSPSSQARGVAHPPPSRLPGRKRRARL